MQVIPRNPEKASSETEHRQIWGYLNPSPPKRGCGRKVWVSTEFDKTNRTINADSTVTEGFLPYLVCLMGAISSFFISINRGISQQEKGDGWKLRGSCEMLGYDITLQGNFRKSSKQNSSHYLSIQKAHSTNDQCTVLPFPSEITPVLKHEELTWCGYFKLTNITFHKLTLYEDDYQFSSVWWPLSIIS